MALTPVESVDDDGAAGGSAVVGDYKERRDRRPSDATRKKVRLQLARALRTLARCRRDLEALPASVRFNLEFHEAADLLFGLGADGQASLWTEAKHPGRIWRGQGGLRRLRFAGQTQGT